MRAALSGAWAHRPCLWPQPVLALPPAAATDRFLHVGHNLASRVLHEGQPLGAVVVAAYGAAAVPATGGMLRLPATNE